MSMSPQGEVRPGLLWSEKGPYLGTVLQPRVALSTEKVSLPRGHSVSHTPYHSPQIRRNLSSLSLWCLHTLTLGARWRPPPLDIKMCLLQSQDHTPAQPSLGPRLSLR